MSNNVSNSSGAGNFDRELSILKERMAKDRAYRIALKKLLNLLDPNSNQARMIAYYNNAIRISERILLSEFIPADFNYMDL